jgi:hypothetical protein
VGFIVSKLHLNKAVKEPINGIHLINRIKKKKLVITLVDANSPGFKVERF